jgi:hypothetical protein
MHTVFLPSPTIGAVVRAATAACRISALALTAAVAVAQVPGEQTDPVFERLARDAAVAEGSFRAPGESVLDSAAAGLRSALGPLDRLLERSRSGADWRKFLDWPVLVEQASSGMAADPKVLRRLEKQLNATETGLDMPQFVAVRKAVTRYAEAADAARGSGGVTRFSRRLDDLASALLSASATGQADMLADVPPILERLAESGQATGLVAGIRGALARPNIELEVGEGLVAPLVNRPIDQVQPVDDVVLGTRIRGSGRTTGSVRLDFVPAPDRAVFDLVLDATNISETRGTQGPVTVRSRGVTALGARRRVALDGENVSAAPVEASASTDSQTTGMSISSRFGRRIIQRIASKKIAETRPRAEAVAESKARDRVRQQFAEQTEPALAQIRQQLRDRLRGPLESRGLYPEMVHLHTTDTSLRVVARKSAAGQLAAHSAPPAALTGNLITARVHESAVNNILEEKLGGRVFTKADVERIAKENNATLPDSLDNEADDKPWSVTFAKHRPVTVAAGDGRVKLMVRGDKFVSGDRAFEGMDIWATYRIESTPWGQRLVRDGDVQIYPPGFKPGGVEKLTMKETSLRRILQKRFDKLFKSEIEIPDLEPKGELAAGGPLPMNQLTARRDGWVVAGWRKADRIVGHGGSVVPGTIIHERVIDGIPLGPGEEIVHPSAAHGDPAAEAAVSAVVTAFTGG